MLDNLNLDSAGVGGRFKRINCWSHRSQGFLAEYKSYKPKDTRGVQVMNMQENDRTWVGLCHLRMRNARAEKDSNVTAGIGRYLKS